MSQIHRLKRLRLRDVWPHEAHDFTPWLADNLDLLASCLNLDLESLSTEVTLPLGGRVDMIAKQATTEATVVIENQLGASDDAHCLGLLGYAANADANILVWIAGKFSDYHQSIMRWLNETDNISVYAVAVKAYQVDGRTAVDFQIVVEPPELQAKASSTYYADFYRCVVPELRHRGLFMVGRGGFRGRYRSFQTGYDNVYYSTGFYQGRPTATLGIYREGRHRIYQSLTRHRAHVDAELDGRAEWYEGHESCFVWLISDKEVEDHRAIPEWVGPWFTEKLPKLRDVVQPILEQVMSELALEGADDNEVG